MKIFIVDNDKNTLEFLRESVSSKGGYEVEVARSGEEAIETMKTNYNYDLIILDIMMPNISGLDICEFMLKDEKLKNTPVLLVSALPVSSISFQESLKRVHDLKIVKGVLEKPFGVDELINKIKSIIGK